MITTEAAKKEAQEKFPAILLAIQDRLSKPCPMPEPYHGLREHYVPHHSTYCLVGDLLPSVLPCGFVIGMLIKFYQQAGYDYVEFYDPGDHSTMVNELYLVVSKIDI